MHTNKACKSCLHYFIVNTLVTLSVQFTKLHIYLVECREFPIVDI